MSKLPCEQRVPAPLGVMMSQGLGVADVEVSFWDGLGSNHSTQSQGQRGNGQDKEELTLVDGEQTGKLWPMYILCLCQTMHLATTQLLEQFRPSL